MLPAGNYSFTLIRDLGGSVFTISRGTQPVAPIPIRGINYTISSRSKMVLENSNVRKLSLPQIGMTFEYPAHNPGHWAAPREPQIMQIIPLGAVGAGR